MRQINSFIAITICTLTVSSVIAALFLPAYRLQGFEYAGDVSRIYSGNIVVAQN